MNVKQTNEYFETNGIIAIRADKGVTKTANQIDSLLQKLGNKTKAIPFYAIYPPGGGEPVVLDGLISSQQVIDTFKSFETDAVAKSNPLDWGKFSKERLAQLRKDGKSVLIHFDAPGHLNAEVNKVTALDVAETHNYLKQHDIVPLIVEKGYSDEDGAEIMKSLGNPTRANPFCVLYPKGNGEPVALGGLITKEMVIDAFEKLNANDTTKKVAIKN